MGVDHVFIVFHFMLGISINGAQLFKTVYIDERCGDHVAVESEMSLKLSNNETSMFQEKTRCPVYVDPEYGYKFLAYVNSFDFPSKSNGACRSAGIELYDGYDKKLHLCGYNNVGGRYKITSKRLRVRVITDGKGHNMSLSITVTKYYTRNTYEDYCKKNIRDFACSNYRCIAEHLRCNNFQNCGDGSDETCMYVIKTSYTTGAGVVIGVGIAWIFICCSLCYLFKALYKAYCRRNRNATSKRTPASVLSKTTSANQENTSMLSDCRAKQETVCVAIVEYSIKTYTRRAT